MTSHDFILALARTTLCTSLAAGAVWYLLARFHLASPRVHRVAWLLVVAQGWLMFPWTFEIEALPALAADVAVQLDSVTPLQVSQGVGPTIAPPRDIPARIDFLDLLLRAIVFAWMLGAATIAVPFAWRYARFALRLPRAVDSPLSPWQTEWKDQLRRANIRQLVELRVTRDLGPLLCWIPFGYLVLVPQTLWQLLTRAEREAILRHELAHFARGDLWKSLVIHILALPQWFNPFVWRAVRAFDEAGEWACDDLVNGADRVDGIVLARSLLRTGEYTMGRALPGTMGANGGQLSRRIRRLVGPDFKEESKMKKCVLVGALVSLAVSQSVRIERVAADEARAPTMVPHNKAPVDKMFDGKKYLAEWEQSSLGPYSIEPPDILRIKIANVSRIPSRSQHSDDQPLEDTYLVGPDGRVELGDWGSVYVTGLTPTKAANQIQRQLRKRVGCREAEVTVELPAPNSKVVYLITKSQNSGDNVVRMPYMPAMTITDLLDQAAPHTVDLDGAKITLRRRDVESVDQKSGAKLKADEIALKVDWDEKHYEPAEDTDYALFSGDRIVVTLTESPTKNEESIFPAAYQGERYVSPPAIRARRIDLNPSTGRIVARGIESIGNPQPSDVIFDIDLVTDPEGALIEFKSLKNGKGFVIADTETILPALRIMASHGIIEKFAWPRISCHVGQAENMVCSTTDHDDPWSAFRMDVTAEKLDTALALELKLASTKSPNDHDATLSVTVANDETLVVRADWWNEKVRGADKPVSSNVYVVVTPRLIK